MTPDIRPEIRQARADDAAFIARNILLAQRGHRSRGWFDIALARPEEQVLDFIGKLAVARQRSWWHAAHFIVAEVDGQRAAALCALPVAGADGAAAAAIKEVAGKTGLSAREIFRRGAYLDNCWVEAGDGGWLIEHVASLPAFRGRGLVQALIAHALSAGKAAGYATASIPFLIGNDAAEHCYAKAGFSFAEEKRDPGFEALTGAPGFRRFARAI
jgi:ribosomal protein S18 acetylase RimI-like enzyme